MRGGYTGRLMVDDLTRARHPWRITVVSRRFLGGFGVNNRLFLVLIPGTDALSPQNPVIFGRDWLVRWSRHLPGHGQREAASCKGCGLSASTHGAGGEHEMVSLDHVVLWGGRPPTLLYRGRPWTCSPPRPVGHRDLEPSVARPHVSASVMAIGPAGESGAILLWP